MNTRKPGVPDLRELEEWYVESINAAIAQSRYDVVDELVAEFEATSRNHIIAA